MTSRSLPSVLLRASVAVVTLGAVLLPAFAAAAAAGRSRPTRADWTVYHGTARGSGDSGTGTPLTHAVHAWTALLGGQIYGEPLVATGRVLVATEGDTVYALDARSGRRLWSTQLGTPVPARDLPCGDISPTVGVTGTPVIDRSRRELFVVADELVAGRPSHHLVGLTLRAGTVVFDRVVDPPRADPAALLQRTGLALDRGSVVFGLGGNDGDCGSYHGWVVEVSVDRGPVVIRRYEVDHGAGEDQGAVWMGGAAPEVGRGGDIWVAVGNGSGTRPGAPYDGSDAVVVLDRRLQRVAYFAPAGWRSDNARDLDLGSTAPALVSRGVAVQAGKSGVAYLLHDRRGHLGGIGGAVTSVAVCAGGAADGGDAVTRSVVFLPCRSGIQALHVGAASLSVLWRASAADGPPIVAGGLVWSIGGSSLFGITALSGEPVERLTVGSNANHFPTPAFGDGVLLATGGLDGDAVVAFRPQG